MTTLHRQQGFTLIEVITVMVLLVALATITVKSTAQLAFDGRYQVTEDRYDKIKTAILGNPNQMINGHPSVSGFVADMGRLPSCLRELIDGTHCNSSSTDTGFCSDGSNSVHDTCLSTVGNTWRDLNWQAGYCLNNSDTTQAACVNASSTWIPLGYGWRGGYIETIGDPANTNAFSDGWGALGNDGNYGWNYCLGTANVDTCYSTELNADELVLQSKGKDGITAVTNDTYDADYPVTKPTTPLSTKIAINSNDWLVTPNVVNVTITPKPTSTPIDRPTSLLDCQIYGGNWDISSTPNFCEMKREYSKGFCTVLNLGAGATWDVTNYRCSKVEIFNTPPNQKNLCLDLYYRKDGAMQHIQNQTPNPQVTENGMTQIVPFSLTGANIPVGKAAFRITDCATAVVYPLATRSPQIVNIMPNAQTLDFTW